MNTLNGYSKSTLTDNNVLTASGGHRAVGNANGNIPLNNGTLNTNLNADLLDGIHANGLFTNLTNSGNNISITVGGITKTIIPAYATKAEEVTNIYESKLKWGNINISGSLSPVDVAMDGQWSANRLSFMPADDILVEYSTNGGSTWSDYGLSDNQKQSLVTTGLSTTIYPGKNHTRQKITDKVRVTITAAKNKTYFSLKKIYAFLSTNGASGTKVKIEKAMCGSDTTFVNVGDYSVSGWTGWNSIPLYGLFGGEDYQTGNIRRLRLTFYFEGYGNNFGETDDKNAVKFYISKISMIGETSWSNSGGSLPATGHLYSYDINKTATFPAGVIIKGNAANKPLVVRGIVGYDGSANIAELYLQYGADKAIHLGNTGAYTISKDGSTYSGAAAKLSVNGGSISKPVYFANGIPTEVTSIDNSLINVIGGTSTLAWDTENILATIAGQEIKAKLPSNPNTDVKVKLDITTSNTFKPIVLGYNDISSTTSVTDLVYYSSKIYVNPSNGSLCLTDTGGLVLKADSGDPPQIRFMRGDSTDTKVDWTLAGSRVFQIRYSVSGSDFINVFETASNLVTISTPLTVKNIFEAASNSVTIFKPLTVNDIITSTVSLGTAPLIINSTTKVNNLNADMLDGKHAEAFALKDNLNSTLLGFGYAKISVYEYQFLGYDHTENNAIVECKRGIAANDIVKTKNSITLNYTNPPTITIINGVLSNNTPVVIETTDKNSSDYYTGYGKVVCIF